MPKTQLLLDITEPTLNVILADLLRKRALQALGEVVVHKKAKGVGKKPDVLMTVNGIKVIIEGKFESSGIDTILEKQCIERVEEGISEICIGVLYPEITIPVLSPSMKDVETKLKKTKFKALIIYVASPDFEQLTLDSINTNCPPGLKRIGWNEVNLNNLADLVRASYTSVIAEDVLGKAVESFANALQSAADKLITSQSPSVLAEQISQVMEIPEVEDEESED